MMNIDEERIIAEDLVSRWVELRLGEMDAGPEEGCFSNKVELLDRLALAVGEAAPIASVEQKAAYQAAFNKAVDAVGRMDSTYTGLRTINATLALNGLPRTVLGPLFAFHVQAEQDSNVVELHSVVKANASPAPATARV